MNTVNTSKVGPILLLGDDGRMAQLLQRRFANLPVEIEGDVLNGLVRFSQHNFPTVLLHAGALEKDASHAVKALRRLAPHARLLLYGEPYTEIFSRPAVSAGADDYLIWPVGAAQLRDALQGRHTAAKTVKRNTWPEAKPVGPTQPAAAPAQTPAGIDPALLSRYRELAQLVPKGRQTLIQHAHQLAGDLLGVEWVEISLTGPCDESPEGSNEQVIRPRAGQIVTLRDPTGAVGELRLGPQRSNASPVPGLAQHLADFLATLLYLTQRDESLKHLATVDELTGAFNRRYLEYFLREVIEQSKHEHTQVTLLMFDIDEFKHYNDTYGHLAGDEVLRECYKLMRQCCRPHDVVARMGGDEFAVLFWDTGQSRPVYRHSAAPSSTTPAQQTTSAQNSCPASRVQTSLRHHPEVALFLSNRFRRMLKTSSVPSLGPEACGNLAISGGLACFPWDGSTVQELLAKADEALLTAKRSGKNRIYLVGQPESV